MQPVYFRKKRLVTKSLLRFIPKSRRAIYRAFSNRYFPVNFWLRNSLRLKNTGLKEKSSLWRKRYLIFHLVTRIGVFNEIIEAPGRLDAPGNGTNSLDEYCTRCGMCCEIASGIADFPKDWPFPDGWKRLFTDGCGKNQWFCAFLIEDEKTGHAQCAIYPYRPEVCRKFERDECIYLNEKADVFTKNPISLRFFR